MAFPLPGYVGPPGFDDPFDTCIGPTNQDRASWGSAPVSYRLAGMIVDRALMSHAAPRTSAGRYPSMSGAMGSRAQFQDAEIRRACGIPQKPSAFHRGWDLIWGGSGANSIGTPVTLPFPGQIKSVYSKVVSTSDDGCIITLDREDAALVGVEVNYHHITNAHTRVSTLRPEKQNAGAIVGEIADHANGSHLHLETSVVRQAGPMLTTLPLAAVSDRYYLGRISPWYIWGWEYWYTLPPRLKYNFLYLAEGPLSPAGILHIAAFAHILHGDIDRFGSTTLTTLKKAIETWFKHKCIRIDANETIKNYLSNYPISDLLPAPTSETAWWNPRVSCATPERLREVGRAPGWRSVQLLQTNRTMGDEASYILDREMWTLVAPNANASDTMRIIQPLMEDLESRLATPPDQVPAILSAEERYAPLFKYTNHIGKEHPSTSQLVTSMYESEFRADSQIPETVVDPRGNRNPYGSG